MAPETVSTRGLLDKLGIKEGARVVVLGDFEAAFMNLLLTRTTDVSTRRTRGPCDVVLMRARDAASLRRLRALKEWIEPNGAIWVVRTKGPGAPLKDTDLIQAGLDAGLVDNKIASFSDSEGAMRFVFRLRDRKR